MLTACERPHGTNRVPPVHMRPPEPDPSCGRCLRRREKLQYENAIVATVKYVIKLCVINKHKEGGEGRGWSKSEEGEDR